ncbi:MAG TPA: phosphoenolpyruvate carboxykinase (GTP) [Spirochaetia bacterium]|nr:phosphoenolpyruvate carboxykinase (GTP) [Spirochaetia bacterium]
MLELRKGLDILSEGGGVRSAAEAQKTFAASMDASNRDKISRISNDDALLRIANAIALCRPASVFVVDSSPRDVDACRRMSLDAGEECPLAMKGHTLHFDLPEDQGRMVDQTFYIANPDEEVSALAKKMAREEALNYIRDTMGGIMEGKTMLVGFYSRGPIGAQASIPALMISSSAYVLHSANILYRSVFEKFDAEAKRAGVFFTNLHSQGSGRSEDIPRARIFMDRSWFTTFSMYCSYAGNTLMLKKGNHRFAVDLCTYYRRGKELSEHMFITGLKGPGGRTTYFAGAAPSGCGKTTTAMVGTDYIGDDLAQMWIAPDGTLRAVNPEIGIFGIVEDLNKEGDPYLYKCMREEGTELIWSNVLVDYQSVPHWSGSGEPLPPKGRNFQGEWWPGKTDAKGKPVPISNPNARITLSNDAIGNFNRSAAGDPAGVPISVITYSGRDSDTMPPVWVARTPDEGVVIGASILSAATATEVGAKGVSRQPWANSPFIPCPLGDYMEAQLEFFNSPAFSAAGRPLIAGLNYFLIDCARGGDLNKLLGEKRDVKAWLSWLERYKHGEVGAIETPIGFIPRYDDLKKIFDALVGKAYTRDLYDKQFAFYVDNILARIQLQEDAYRKDSRMPARLFQVYEKQKQDLLALKEKHGSIVPPDKLDA